MSEAKYKGWVNLDRVQMWENWIMMENARLIPQEELEKFTNEDLGFDVFVDVYLSEEGKIRAYCEYDKSEYCIHSWIALQGALKNVALKTLEMEYDFIEALRKLKNLSDKEKEELFKKRGIDLDDLKAYITALTEENKEEIEIWFGNIEGLIFYMG